MLKKSDKILYFDIETSPVIASVWGCGKQYVTSDQVLKERKLLTIAYMWEGDKKPTVLTLDLKKHKPMEFDDDADRAMLEKFVKVLLKAQLLVAHNGRRFDLSRIRARLVRYGMPDLPPIPFDDSYQFTKDIDFTSHKLNYISKVLGKGSKIKTDYDLWLRVSWHKEQKALNEMARYNVQDVILLAKAYRELRNYGQSRLNLSISRGNPNTCPKCGEKAARDGYVLRAMGKYQRYECKNGHKFRDGLNLISGQKHYSRSI